MKRVGLKKMAKKRSPVTVAGIRAKTAAQSSPKSSSETSSAKRQKFSEPNYKNAYSFVARKFKKHSFEGNVVWESATEVCEFLFHVPKDFQKFGAVGSARKYLSGLFLYLSQTVAKP